MALLCGDRTFVLGKRTLIMGILNIAPDSFSDGGEINSPGAAVQKAKQLLADGADIIDVGAESTRPFADDIGLQEELSRIIPTVKALIAEGVRNLSIDTRRAEVARICLAEGASWINDVSGLRYDKKMLDVVQAADAVVVMHSQGSPQNMQRGKIEYSDVVLEVTHFLRQQVECLVEAGYERGRILVDPGIGFGKSLKHNLLLTQNLQELAGIAGGVLYGPSRKFFLSEITGIKNAAERDFATLGAVVYAALHGANIVRVHNVKAAHEALLIADSLK